MISFRDRFHNRRSSSARRRYAFNRRKERNPEILPHTFKRALRALNIIVICFLFSDACHKDINSIEELLPLAIRMVHQHRRIRRSPDLET